MNEVDEDIFTLFGGPGDGRTMLVTGCEHGWPIITIEGDATGAYVYRFETDRYEWDPS